MKTTITKRGDAVRINHFTGARLDARKHALSPAEVGLLGEVVRVTTSQVAFKLYTVLTHEAEPKFVDVFDFEARNVFTEESPSALRMRM